MKDGIEQAPGITDGLLHHEFVFVQAALVVAREKRHEANMAYGDAVANSGGDWAFDDPTTQAAAQEAAREDDAVRKLTSLLRIAEVDGIIPYPLKDCNFVVIGSRVQVKTDQWQDAYDLVSHKIPGIPEDNASGATLLSYHSPLGAVLFGKKLGEEVRWSGPSARIFEAQIIGIDQMSQQEYYAKALSMHEAPNPVQTKTVYKRIEV